MGFLAFNTIKVSGATQNDIFLDLIHRYFKDTADITEYDYVLCLSLTYNLFRKARNTFVDKKPTNDFSNQTVQRSCSKKILGVFPICDAEFDQSKNCEPRFLKKFPRNLVNIDDIEIYYRIAKSDENTKSIAAITISTREFLKEIKFSTCFLILCKIFFAVLPKKIFRHCNFKQKIMVLKSLFLFEANFTYFSHVNKYYLDKFEKLYLTNFYSPENLGLVKSFLACEKEVVDLQHGVQKNVVAYEHKHILPSTLLPTEFFLWFNHERETIQSGICNYNLNKIEKDLKTGKGMKLLITLQPSNSTKFFEDINQLNLSRHFVKIRPHPRRILSKNDLENLLDFNFEYDVMKDISMAFEGIDLHLTEYSSCVLDGLQLGVPSFCFHPIARDYFDDPNIKGCIRIYENIDEFLNND